MTRTTRMLAAVALTLVAGCGVPGQSKETQLGDAGVNVIAPSSTTSLPPGTETRLVDLCLIYRDRIVAIPQRLPSPLSVRRTLRALVDAPRGGFTTGTRSAILDAGLVSDRGASGGVARVDLAAEFSELSPNDQILALAQVVCTLTSLPGIGQVRFTQDGAPVEVLRGDNSLADEPVSRADYQRLLPAP